MRGRLGALLLLLLAATAYVVFLFLPPSWWQKQFEAGNGPAVFVMVEQGMNARDAARRFVGEGVTSDAQALSRWLTVFGVDRSLKPGLYSLRPGSPWEVAKQLVGIEPQVFSVVLVPGADLVFFLESLTASVSAFWRDACSGEGDAPFGKTEKTLAQPAVSSADLLAALAEDGNFPEPLRAMLPVEPVERFAFLLPETYMLPPSPSLTASLVRQASSMWWRAFASDVAGRNEGEVHSLAILASVVEKEIRREEERPVAAGVFRNRLERKIPLQSCATVVYAWKLKGRAVRSLTYEDLKIDSPFNTYLHSGLPPAPICVPSRNSWFAAFHPEEHDLLYFVADNRGGHVFSRTYKEHLDAQRKIRNDGR